MRRQYGAAVAKKSTVIHRRYSDQPERVMDLGMLSICNNINGPICGPENLTSDPKRVTCGRCLRIAHETVYGRGGNPDRYVPPFKPRDLRRISRELAFPGSKRREKSNDLSAWAGLRRVHGWLLRLAEDDEVPIQINTQAKEMAVRVEEGIVLTGGGKSR